MHLLALFREGRMRRLEARVRCAGPAGDFLARSTEISEQRRKKERCGHNINSAAGPSHGFHAQRIQRPEQRSQRGPDDHSERFRFGC